MRKVNNTKTFQLLITVDKEKLRSARNGFEWVSVKEAIQQEFKWLHESGIYLEEISQQKIEKKNTSNS